MEIYNNLIELLKSDKNSLNDSILHQELKSILLNKIKKHFNNKEFKITKEEYLDLIISIELKEIKRYLFTKQYSIIYKSYFTKENFIYTLNSNIEDNIKYLYSRKYLQVS